jgi:hypothetical protein
MMVRETAPSIRIALKRRWASGTRSRCAAVRRAPASRAPALLTPPAPEPASGAYAKAPAFFRATALHRAIFFQQSHTLMAA